MGRQTPYTLWLATAKPGDTFARMGVHDTKMALAARRAGKVVETAKGMAVTGMKAAAITIATMRAGTGD